MSFDIKSRYSGDPVSAPAVPLSQIPHERGNSGYSPFSHRTMEQVIRDEEVQRRKWRAQYDAERKKPGNTAKPNRARVAFTYCFGCISESVCPWPVDCPERKKP